MSQEGRESLADAWRALTSPAMWKLLVAVGTPLGAAGTYALKLMHGELAAAVAQEQRRADQTLYSALKDVAGGYKDRDQRVHDGTDNTAAREAVLEQQLVAETANRVRYQAAVVERDWRKREASGASAEHAFLRLARDWPCVTPPNWPCSDNSGCCPPNDAARIALGTKPP
jgi:hypothetical protein